jgi:hypothetical protein
VTGLAIERGAGMADIMLLIERDKADARKLSPAYVARCQARSPYAWTWRRPDGSPVICAGLAPVGPSSDRRLFEAWFTCRPDLGTPEIHDFLIFARFTLLCVAREALDPLEVVAWVAGGPERPGGRLAKLAGFEFDRDVGGQSRFLWHLETERVRSWARRSVDSSAADRGMHSASP